ncbi:hypothetical protein [Myroides guanonis]|uniref:Uncharacterized protein n=1 Tax=Myroides guanonis TaxID=1150112 RepID=A0A1I3U036_9FLAO|nr:hypothetical protein [Myroides guanonis]SFJ76918.1 hypothetical protein SAMN04487893_11595 [Myroides guanonis]
MKYFTHPEGIFEIKIPLDWHYKNEVAGYENKSPFSFELFQNTQGCFQISCYNKNERKINPNLPKGLFNNDKLHFIRTELPDDEFKIFLWATVVEDYFFMAKYVCQPTKRNLNIIKKQIKKVEDSLSTLMCLSLDRREFAMNYDRFEKFNASLAASFDLKNKAIKNRSYIELIIITANQIDAYLRLIIVHKFQIIENSSMFKLEYLYQAETDKPIMEKKIYDKAKEMAVISEEQYNQLYKLYNLRNKVVHRYIITDIKTMELKEICIDYEKICEKIRLILANIEIEQFEKNVGYHGKKDPHRNKSESQINELFSMINDKHFSKEFYRKVK